MGKRQTKKFIAVGVVLAVLLIGAGGAYVYRQNQIATQAEQNREIGMKAYEAGEDREALRPLSRYISRVKDDGEAMYAFADTRRNVPAEEGGHIAQAMQVARLARALLPSDPRPIRLLLELTLLQSRGAPEPKWTEVLALADRLTELEPDADDASEARIEANLALGREDVALAEAEERANAEGASFEEADRLLRVLMQTEASGERVDAMLDQLSIDYPDRMSVTLFRVQQAASQGRLEEAQDFAEAARSQRFSSVDDAILLSRFTDVFPPESTDGGREAYSASDALLARAIEELEPDAIPGEVETLRTFAALRSWRIGQADAMRWIEPVMQRPIPPENVHAVAAVLDQWRDPSSGYGDELQSIVQRNPGLAVWNDLYEASKSLRADAPDAALTRLRGVPDGGPAGGMARYLRATALLGLNRADEARAQLEPLILERSPFEAVTWRRAGIMLSELYIAADEPERAAEMLAGVQPFRATSPGTELYAEALVSALELDRVEDVGSAMDVFEQLAANAEDRPLVWAWLARARAATGDLSGAESAVERLLATGNADGVKPLISVADRLPESLDGVRDRLLRRGAELVMSGESVPTGELLLLADRLAPIDQALSSQVLSRNDAALTPRAALSKAVVMSRAGDSSGAAALLDGLIASAEDDQRVEFERARTAYLIEVGDAAAAAALMDVAERYPQDAQAQIDALRSPLVADQPIEELAAMVARLRDVSAENDTRWRVFDAELRLRGEPDDQQLSAIVLSLVQHSRVSPDDFQAMLLLSEARQRLGDEQGAIAALEEALEAGAPPELQGLLVRRLIAAGRTSEANRRLVEFAGVAIEPGPALAERAQLLESRGYVDLAVADRARLAAVGGVVARAESISAEARALGTQQAQREAMTDLEALAADPELAPAEIDAIARAMLSLGESEAGFALLERLPARSDFGIRDEIAAAYFMTLGRFDDAIERIESVPAEERTLTGWMMAVRASVARNDLDGAVAVLDDAIARNPDHAGLQQVRRTLTSDRSDDPLRDLAGLVPLLASELAEQTFIPLDRAASAYVDGTIGRAAFLDRLEQVTGAEPGLFTVWRMRVIGERAERGVDAAIQVAREATEAVPIDPRPQLLLASLLFEAQRYNESIPAYRRWMELEPNREIEGVAAIALSELARGRPEAALNELQPVRGVIESSGTDSQIALLAQALAMTNRAGEARAAIGDRVEREPLWWDEMVRIASVMPTASLADRRVWLSEVTEDGSDHVEADTLTIAWYDLAVASAEPANLMVAAERLERSLEVQPRAEWFMRLAIVRELQGDPESAELAYQNALELEPENPVALNNLAFIIHNQPGRGSEAVDLATRAVAARPGFVSFVDTLGRSQLAAGDAQTSLATFVSARQQTPDDPRLVLGEIEALLALDRGEEAALLVRSLEARRDLSADQSDRLARAREAMNRP